VCVCVCVCTRIRKTHINTHTHTHTRHKRLNTHTHLIAGGLVPQHALDRGRQRRNVQQRIVDLRPSQTLLTLPESRCRHAAHPVLFLLIQLLNVMECIVSLCLLLTVGPNGMAALQCCVLDKRPSVPRRPGWHQQRPMQARDRSAC
jgi:hypothetical protein